MTKRILRSNPTFYPGKDYRLVQCDSGGASDRLLGTCTVFNKKGGVTQFVLLQRVSGGGGDLSSIGSKGWKFPIFMLQCA